MNTIQSLLVLLAVSALTTYSCHGYVYSKTAFPRARGSVIPKPYSIQTQKDFFTLEPSKFGIAYKLSDTCDIVLKAIDRYIKNKLIFDDRAEIKSINATRGHSPYHNGPIEWLTVDGVKGGKFACESRPYENMDESYNLYTQSIDGNSIDNESGAFLTANTSWGILRGLETFSQLVYHISGTQESKIFAINHTIIYDKPRFSFRGLMIDTARHYIPIEMLKLNIDAMAYNKYNVFHWHMIDDQSFPYVSKLYQNLSQLGAFSENMVYTPVDIKNIIDYANERGIRVLPEFDTPGHTYGMRSIPKLLTECYDKNGKPNQDLGPIDPTLIKNYIFLRDLISEISSLFNDEYFHAGGDEVDMSCWRSNPDITKWMKKHNMTSYTDLNSYYMDRLLNIINYYNKTPIVWQEVFDTGVKMTPDTTVHIWKYMGDPAGYYSELDAVTKAGYKTIFSSCWYLNLINYGQDWVKYYQCDPQSFSGSQTQYDLIKGGEACMWSEFVDDSNLTPRLWPRASTVAERLWSRRDVTDLDDFMPRLEQIRCRLRHRSIAAEPIIGPGYCPGL